MDKLVIDLKDLKKKGLSVAQFLYLASLYYDILVRDMQEIKPEALGDLLNKGYIYGKDNGFDITDYGAMMFESDSELFDKFIELYPTRVLSPNGTPRVLSPSGPDTIAGKKLKGKWDRMTGNRKDLKEHVLKCLEAEINMRKNTNTLHFMRNAETWLNNGTWEDYAYLLENKSAAFGQSSDNKTVIRL